MISWNENGNFSKEENRILFNVGGMIIIRKSENFKFQ